MVSNIFIVNRKTLCKGRPYSEFFWSVFSRIPAEYGDLQSKSLSLVRIWENTDQKNFEYRHFLHGKRHKNKFFFYLGFLSQPFTNHRTVREGVGHFFNSSLPLGNFRPLHGRLGIRREITADSSPLFSGHRSLATGLCALGLS